MTSISIDAVAVLLRASVTKRTMVNGPHTVALPVYDALVPTVTPLRVHLYVYGEVPLVTVEVHVFATPFTTVVDPLIVT